jgi:hypothetical protein
MCGKNQQTVVLIATPSKGIAFLKQAQLLRVMNCKRFTKNLPFNFLASSFALCFPTTSTILQNL